MQVGQEIPRDIYQTWKTRDPATMGRPLRRWLATWRNVNPDYNVHVYDDRDCRDFIAAHHPDHLATYLSLTPVERSDFWRYLVILTFGGVYSDADTICKTPLDSWMRAGDQAVIGIDGDYLDRYPDWHAEGHIRSGGAYNFGYSWHDNVVAFSNWTFAAIPHHPILAEVVRRIEINAADPFFTQRAPDWTIKKTGPGVLTDVLYDWLKAHGVRADDLVRALRHERSITIENVRFMDRPAFHWREVRHFGMGSWKPASVVVAWRKLSRHWS